MDQVTNRDLFEKIVALALAETVENKAIPDVASVSAEQAKSIVSRYIERHRRRPNPAIVFGLAVIRGVGVQAAEHITSERQRKGPFKSLYDLCVRVDHRVIRKATLKALILSGACDSLGDNRREMAETMESLYEGAARMRRDRASGQGSIFG